MKKLNSKRRHLVRNIAAMFLGGAIIAPIIAPEAKAQLYWDSNGTGIAGAGATPTGTWVWTLSGTRTQRVRVAR